MQLIPCCLLKQFFVPRSNLIGATIGDVDGFVDPPCKSVVIVSGAAAGAARAVTSVPRDMPDSKRGPTGVACAAAEVARTVAAGTA